MSTCCECGQLEDRSVDIPILLCDGCDNECHLTCAKDRPKLTKVPEGDWYCSACVKKRKGTTSGKKTKKSKKLTLEERKRLDAEKAATASASGSALSTEELAGLVASSEKKGGDGNAKTKKKVDMDDFDMDSSSSDSDSDDDDNVKPWAKKGKEVPIKKEVGPPEPAVARKKTFEEVKQEMIEKKMKKNAGATAAATGSGAVKAESKPTISLIQSMAPPPSSAVAPPSAVAATAVPLGRAAAGASGRSQSFGQQQQQQQKSWNVAPVKREPASSSSAPTPHQPPRGSPRRSPVPPPSGPPASPHPPILNSPEKRAQSRSLLGKLDGVIDTVTNAPLDGKETASLAWTGSDQDRLKARNNGMDFVSIVLGCPPRLRCNSLFIPDSPQSHILLIFFRLSSLS